MRKKTEGQGIMVTLFVGPDGIGCPLTPDQLATVNAKRSALTPPRSPLQESPGKLYFEYGVRREGYWNSERFCVQVTDALDCFEVLYPGCQFCIEVDQSSGHTKTKSDGLSVSKMCMNWGGKQSEVSKKQT
jgi:hypothetical protein